MYPTTNSKTMIQYSSLFWSFFIALVLKRLMIIENSEILGPELVAGIFTEFITRFSRNNYSFSIHPILKSIQILPRWHQVETLNA